MTGLMQKNHDITKLSAERFCAPPQRVEKGVNSEKRAVLHAEETSRNRAEFRFSRAGAVQRYCPRAKGGKRKWRMNTWFVRHLTVYIRIICLQLSCFSAVFYFFFALNK